ncbi:MAG: DNA-protecting protein DprA [Clostridiales bacterium]|nr:DNA-protecting protein DprA [Clostridiales bacterium]
MAQAIHCCKPEDSFYPIELKNIAKPPEILYYVGSMDFINQNKNVAVIGSRRMSEAGAKLAYAAGRMVGEAGFHLVNGLAVGCDTEALKGALSAGGKCIAILPCGLEQIVPQSNRRLAEKIVESGGCLLSEYPEGTGIKRFRYVERDRLQSGISQGVFVVEAEQSSGTMHTASFAIQQYKRLACYHHKLLELSSGNKQLEEKGQAKVIKNTDDFKRFLQDISEEISYEQMALQDIYVVD